MAEDTENYLESEKSGPNVGEGDITPTTIYHSVAEWSCSQVGSWLRLKGYEESLVTKLTVEQKIDGKSLMLLRENDLRQPPISISVRF